MRSERRYTRVVRRVLMALLTCLFVTVIAADTFACPDDCTNEDVVASHMSVSACALCHGWTQTPVVLAARPIPYLVSRGDIVAIHPLEPVLSIAERPPRTT